MGIRIEMSEAVAGMEEINPINPLRSLIDRFAVLIFGMFGGGLMMALACNSQLPQSWDFAPRFECWGIMMGGPIVSTFNGFAAFHCFIFLGWLALPLIAANTMKPNAATALLAMIGFFLWFGSGFITVIGMVWGA